MDESALELKAQLELCKEQHAQNIFTITKLETAIAEMQPEMDAFRASHGEGSKLHANCKQLKKVFHAHLRCAGAIEEPSDYLLLFYAIECGLKCVYLHRNRYPSTKTLAENGLLAHGHDLKKWCKELRLSALLSDKTVHFRLASDRSKMHHNIDRAHEAWRYGVYIEEEAQAKIIQWLLRLAEWIKPELEAV